MMARNPRITPLHVVGVILLATFGLLLADAGIRIDLPNFTLMGVAMFVLLISGLASLAIDYCTPRLQVCPRISVTDGGVIIQPHRVGPFRLATGALGLCASVMILLSIVPIMRFFPGILVTIAVDGPIVIGLLFSCFLCCDGNTMWGRFLSMHRDLPGLRMAGTSLRIGMTSHKSVQSGNGGTGFSM